MNSAQLAGAKTRERGKREREKVGKGNPTVLWKKKHPPWIGSRPTWDVGRRDEQTGRFHYRTSEGEVRLLLDDSGPAFTSGGQSPAVTSRTARVHKYDGGQKREQTQEGGQKEG